MRSPTVVVTVDQAVSSIGNFAFTLAVARVSGAARFGQIALGYLTLQLLLGLARAAIAEPYLIWYSSAGADHEKVDSAFSSVVAIFATASAAVGIGTAMALDQPTAVVILAAAIPLVLFQDMSRYRAFAHDRSFAALRSDGVWTTGFVLALMIWTVIGAPTDAGVTLTWVTGAFLGLLLLLRDACPTWSPSGWALWWRERRRMTYGYAAEYGFLKVSSHTAAYLLPFVASSAAAGGFRGASSLTNIVAVFFAAVPLVLMPRLRTTVSSSGIERRQLVRSAAGVAIAVCFVTVALGAALLLIGNANGGAILGDTWPAAKPLLPPMLIATGAIGVSMAVLMVLRATARVRLSFQARAFQSLVVLILSVGGAIVGEAEGAAWGFAAGNVLGLAAWGRALNVATRGVPGAGGAITDHLHPPPQAVTQPGEV